MPSITTWSRLEPQSGDGDIAAGYAARAFDPLWLLARQWQLAEFQAEDAGTPIVARWRARVAQLDHFVAGPIPWNTQLKAPHFDAGTIPLQTLVERQPTQRPSAAPGLEGLRLAVEAGQHFLRMLRLQAITSDPGPAFVSAYAVLPLTDAQRSTVDPETAAFVDLMAGRAIDGRRLRQGIGDPANPRLDPSLPIVASDRAEVLDAVRAWLAWSGSLFSEPDAGAQAWQSDRMEYAFTLSARLGDDRFGERPLSAEQYADGLLDWYSFDLNLNINTGTGDDPPGDLIARTVLPAPMTFHGMPAQRFWEMEDARIDLGALQLGSSDLGQLLLVETLTGYGNDWFLIPIDLPAGSLVASASLVVTDTFGVQTLLREAGDPFHQLNSTGSSQFTLSMPVEPGEVGIAASNLFFLADPIVPLEGPVLEEVMLVRDEMANIAWAVERRLESPLEVGLETARDTLDVSEPPTPHDTPLYRLASPVPDHWIPLLPMRPSESSAEVRLARGAVLHVDGQARVVDAHAQILQPADPSARLLIREEEVPREGVVVRRMYQAARWHDGRLFVWATNRASVGRGEASSGLTFDGLDGA
jgi:hypothetical protein